ncbi:HXXEE domain-containing protein [Acidaminobacter sp. JC074]|uniref:HXXEE domain-containing protein n=1 Tax=Acidaminobacter sp. JC074 TaxID=2530199 RepID=UPI001F114A1C|nr:HXXEE domain-containing protein [Acidaminobacter sp. JC074]MCH4889058.1 HXXEE domain-containing protein [Acidaminobacter sp. JC074]
MFKLYLDWLMDNWQKAAILVLIYVISSIVPLYSKIEMMDFLLLLAFPLYLIHEIEEYILPGGFTEFFNENLLKVKSDQPIIPIDREVVFWINLIYIWLIIPLFVGFGLHNIKYAAWLPYFFFFQAIAHLAMGIKGGMLINPGIRSSFLLHMPYAVFMIKLLRDQGVIDSPYFNIYAVIGLLFNLLLPIFAKFVILPRYHKRLDKEKSSSE